MGSLPACRLLLIGMSTSRNFPPTGTAGFARSRVRGQRRDPCPPPRMAVTIFSMIPLPAGVGYLIPGNSWGQREVSVEWPHDLHPPPSPLVLARPRLLRG